MFTDTGAKGDMGDRGAKGDIGPAGKHARLYNRYQIDDRSDLFAKRYKNKDKSNTLWHEQKASWSYNV